MLHDTIVKTLLETKIAPLPRSFSREPVDEKYGQSLAIALDKVPAKLQKYLKINKLKISFIKSGKIPKELIDEGHLYGYSDYGKFQIYLAIDRSGMLCVKNILHNFYHELGHFAFLYVIGLSYRNVKVKESLQKFQSEPSVSILSDKYMKNIYAKKLREANKHMIFGIDIKYHENFAEIFRLYLENNLPKKYEILSYLS